VSAFAKVPGYQTAESQADAAPPRRLAQTIHTPPKVLRVTPIYAAICSKSEASEPFIRFPRRFPLRRFANRCCDSVHICTTLFQLLLLGMRPTGLPLGRASSCGVRRLLCE
jgi:hypothetical protein